MRYAFLGLILMIIFTHDAAAQKRPQRQQTVRVQITKMGYEPGSFSLAHGVPARITFIRRTNDTCATEVVFPDYGIRRTLPLDQAVTIAITPRRAGTFTFACGMNMHRGRMIVR